MLNFIRIGPEIAALGNILAEAGRKRAASLTVAEKIFRSLPSRAELTALIEEARTGRIHAYPVEEPSRIEPAPPLLDNYIALAADGSQLVPDRHEPHQYYVINISEVQLTYGIGAAATLTSNPALRDMAPAEGELIEYGEELHREGYVAEERLIGELETLRDLCAGAAGPGIALYDGSLIFWPLENSRPPERRKKIIAVLLEWFDAAAKNGIIPAGYISRPGAREVCNDLALLVCDRSPVDCPACRTASPDPNTRPCSVLSTINDGLVYDRVLRPGERSAIFDNRTSRIISDYVALGGPEARIAYCYVRGHSEVCRVEFPARVTAEPAAAVFLQAAILDQCDKGQGYPRALQLAHEYALVGEAERRAFLDLLATIALPRLASPKELAKRSKKI